MKPTNRPVYIWLVKRGTNDMQAFLNKKLANNYVRWYKYYWPDEELTLVRILVLQYFNPRLP